MTQRHDGLTGLTKAHFVGEDGAWTGEQEGDTFDLVREQAHREGVFTSSQPQFDAGGRGRL